MNQFTISNLISRDNSTVTGSLTVLGSIDTVIGTASLAQTSSQTQQASTASFTTVNLVQTSSYSQTSVSSSYALTASFVENKSIGVNTIGWLSPNVFMGEYGFNAAKNTALGIQSGGTFFSPIEIKKTCTCATMSVTFVGPLAASSCYVALYTNSSNNLPEYRIFHGETAKSVNTTIYQNYLVTQSAVTLEKGSIYWIALSLSGSGISVATLAGITASGSIYNEFLGNRLSVASINNNNPIQLIYIRSGSANLNTATYTFPETSSQVISNYHTGINDAQARYMLRMPFLKVEYT
jgi:hypothetical protein